MQKCAHFASARHPNNEESYVEEHKYEWQASHANEFGQHNCFIAAHYLDKGFDVSLFCFLIHSVRSWDKDLCSVPLVSMPV